MTRGSRRRRRRNEVARFNLNQDVRQRVEAIENNPFAFYSYSTSATYRGKHVEKVEDSYAGLASYAYRGDSVVAACMRVRRDLFRQAKFCWREVDEAGPGKIFRTPELDLLDRPWPNGTTGELLARMITDVDLCGNSFIRHDGERVRWLRPDWVSIVLSGDPQADADIDVLGYVYTPGGTDPEKNGHPYQPDEICHWAPEQDPLAFYRGMSWVSKALEEVQGDRAATTHKMSFFRNGATLGPIVRVPAGTTMTQFKEFMAAAEEAHAGAHNAYKTLYLGGGAEVTLAAADFRQLDLKSVQGGMETRIAAVAGVHPVLVGLSEGLAGSSLNSGNFAAARRATAEMTLFSLWQDACGALQAFFDVPDQAELWIRERDIPFLREEAKDRAEIFKTQVLAIEAAMRAGFKPDPAVQATLEERLDLLIGNHTGLFSVQMQPPSQGMEGAPPLDVNNDGQPDQPGTPIDFGALRADLWDVDEDDIERALVEAYGDDLEDDDEDLDEVDRARYDVRVPKGFEGGGRFRKLSDRLVALLNDWAKGEGDDDPLDQFSRDQLRRVAKEFADKALAAGDHERAARLTPRRGASSDEIKLALYKDVRGHVRGQREAKAEAPGRAKFTLQGGGTASRGGGTPRVGREALASVPVHVSSQTIGRRATDIRGLDGLSERQQQQVLDSVDAYRGLGYKGINNHLRTGEPARGATTVVAGIDRGMRESRLPDPIVVFRSNKSGEPLFGPSADWPDNLTGREWTDAAYSSTTATEGILAKQNDGTVAMRLTVPAGTPAMKLSDFEGEVLLDRGLTYRVVADHGPREITDGLGNRRTFDRYLDVEVVPRSPAPAKPSSLRGVDVAVYRDPQGRPALYRENDAGQRGALVKRFDSLDDLAQWADDNGEPRVAEWARKEAGAPDAPRPPVKKATPRKAAPKPGTDLTGGDPEALSKDEMLALSVISNKGTFADGGWVRPSDLPADQRRHLAGLAEKGWLQKEGDNYRIDPRGFEARQGPTETGALVGDVLPARKPAESTLSLAKVNRGAIIDGHVGKDGTFTNEATPGSRPVRVVVQRIDPLDQHGQPITRPLMVGGVGGLGHFQFSGEKPQARIIGHDVDTGRRIESAVVPANSHWEWLANPSDDTSADIPGEIVPERPRLAAGSPALSMYSPSEAAKLGPGLDMTVPESRDVINAEARRRVETVLDDVDEMLAGDASDRALLNRLDGRRKLGAPASVVDELSAAVNSGDRDRVRQVSADIRGRLRGPAPAQSKALPSGADIELAKDFRDLSPAAQVQGHNLTPAGQRALDSLGAAGHPRIAAIPDTEGKVREAYRMLQLPGQGTDSFVALEDVRKLIGEQVPRSEVDDTLHRMWRMPDVQIAPQSYGRQNRAERIPAAIMIGGQEQNLLHIDDPTLARPKQFPAVDMAQELVNRRDGGPRHPMMVNLTDAELRAEVDRRIADPITARDVASEVPGYGAPSAAPAKKAPGRAPKPTVDEATFDPTSLDGLTIRQKRARLKAMGFSQERIDEIAPTPAMAKASNASAVSAALRGGGSEGEYIRALAADQSLTSARLREVAADLGIDVPEGMRAKTALQLHIASAAAKKFGPGDGGLAGRMPTPGASTAFDATATAERLAQVNTAGGDIEAELAKVTSIANLRKVAAALDIPSPTTSTGERNALGVDLTVPSKLTAAQWREYIAATMRRDRTRWSIRSADVDEDDLIRADLTLDDDEGEYDDEGDEPVDELDLALEHYTEDDVERAAGHDVTPGHDELHHYWTRGEGLAKWVGSPKPWTTLVAHLTKYVGERKAKIFASRWFIEVFHFAAGSDMNRVTHGKPPRGHRVGPG